MEDLILTLKQEIIGVLNLEEVGPEDIDENAPLFGGDLGLDSIDVLELIALMQKKYNINITDPNQGEKIFKSVRSMAEYIERETVENK
ncbi:MAG: acyl carrier protein [Bacteroidales bacterium]|nr:acyl carrier protein [Bacteroidales bacterium]